MGGGWEGWEEWTEAKKRGLNQRGRKLEGRRSREGRAGGKKGWVEGWVF